MGRQGLQDVFVTGLRLGADLSGTGTWLLSIGSYGQNSCNACVPDAGFMSCVHVLLLDAWAPGA